MKTKYHITHTILLAIIFSFFALACSDKDEPLIEVTDEYIVQIVPTPINAIVKINGVETYTIKGEKGTEVEWRVEEEDCLPQEGSLIIDNKNITLEVNLKKEQFLLEIMPTPKDAKVVINNQVVNSLMIDKKSEVVWSVEKTGYTTQSGSFQMMEDKTLTIDLEIEPGKDPDEAIGSTGIYRYQDEDGNLVAYTTVRAADGNIWLQHNLGSAQVAKTLTDASSYGDLYAWGRWKDGHESRTANSIMAGPVTPNNPSGLSPTESNPFYYNGTASGYWWYGGTDSDTWTGNTPEMISATNGIDPCETILSEGWRLPSREEWIAVLDAEGITNLNTAFASNIVISAAGIRGANNGALQSVGSMARLWTSTAFTKGNAYLVTINATTKDVPAYSRGGGLSIRCIKTK